MNCKNIKHPALHTTNPINKNEPQIEQTYKGLKNIPAITKKSFAEQNSTVTFAGAFLASGCGAVWLAHSSGGRGVGSSNLLTPTDRKSKKHQKPVNQMICRFFYL